MEARGDKDVFLSSSLLREYVSLEGCELHLARLIERNTCLTLFSDELCHKRPSSPSTIGIRCLYNELEAHTHNQIGGSQTHHESVTTTTHK